MGCIGNGKTFEAISILRQSSHSCLTVIGGLATRTSVRARRCSSGSCCGGNEGSSEKRKDGGGQREGGRCSGNVYEKRRKDEERERVEKVRMSLFMYSRG